NLIHDVGYLDMAMVCSPAQLVLGNEAIRMTKRFIEGIRVTQETIARHVIESVGPGGHFLAEDHTVEHFRNELWRYNLLTHQSREKWEDEGSKDMAQRIQEKLKEILDSHKIPPLPARTIAALHKIKSNGEAELTNAQS
ncbi:MAG: trimethylamine methyltransferase family protein, partial [Desulfobacterales bacterium]